MPDDYEKANGSNSNSSSDRDVDADGDGMTNYQEYAAGTDPRSPASVLRRVVIRSGDDITITFASTFRKMYSVEQSDAPGEAWVTLTDNLLGTGGGLTVSDVEPFEATMHRMYRVVAQ
jgi:hypothetical protein